MPGDRHTHLLLSATKAVFCFTHHALKHRRQTWHVHLRQYLSLLFITPEGPGFYTSGSVIEYTIIHRGKKRLPTVQHLILHCADTQCGIFEPNGKTFPL